MNSTKRIASLDMMRGLTIAAMILVSNPGSWDYVYHPLTHAPWHNITPTDLIFPFFIFIVGISIVFALNKRIQCGVPPKEIYRKIITRSCKIMILGIFLNLYPSFNILDYGWSGVGYTGVLPRIAIVYLVCAILFLKTTWKTQVIIGVTILILYWIVMCFIPVPGIGVGVLEPGNNMAAWIDSSVLSIYPGKWVPEGFFSTFPAIVTGMCGMLVGRFLLCDTKSFSKQDTKLIWLMAVGFIAFVFGTMWGWIFPINKNIWTSSFVLYTAGLGTLTLSICMFFIDNLGYSRWSRFGVIFGSNAITIYVLSHVIKPYICDKPFINDLIMSRLFMDKAISMGISPSFASMLFAGLYVLICFIPAYYMYKRKIFIKV